MRGQLGRTWITLNRWSPAHSVVVMWAFYLGLLVVMVDGSPSTGETWAKWVLLPMLMTGWFVTWLPGAVIMAFAAVLWALLGYRFFSIELGSEIHPAVSTYLVGLAVLGIGRVSRVFYDRNQETLHQRRHISHLESRQDFQARFLNMAAHEIGTPLTPIKLQLATLMARADDEVRPGLERLQRNVRRLERLTEDMLQAGRLQAGEMKLDKRPVDLASIVHDAVEDSREQAQERGIAIDADLTAAPVVADPDRVGQVAWNMVRNAIRYSPGGGNVRVRTWQDAVGAHIRVQDDGLGMDEEQLAGLFQPFAQFHRDKVQAGNGLGLYICQGIMAQHGGAITASSDGAGQGSTFMATFPR